MCSKRDAHAHTHAHAHANANAGRGRGRGRAGRGTHMHTHMHMHTHTHKACPPNIGTRTCTRTQHAPQTKSNANRDSYIHGTHT